jgi:spore maturation protein CgeB
MPNTSNSAELRILYLTYDCSESVFPYPCGTNYPEEFQKFNNKTWVFIYKDLYRQYGNKGFHEFIRNLIEVEKINVLIFTLAMDFEIHVDFFRELSKKLFVVFYTGDDISYFDMHYKYVCQAADLVITNIVFAPYKYEELGVPALLYPPAFDTSVYKPLSGLFRDIDVSFIGYMGNKKNRLEYLSILQKNGINVRTWGYNSENGVVTRDKKIEIYNRSKINIDFTGNTETSIYTADYPTVQRIRHIKGRSIEISLTRSFLLSEYSPGMERWLEPNKETAVFHNAQELLDKVRYYLEHPAEREKIADNAYNRSTREYEIVSQTGRMLEEIRERVSRKNLQGDSNTMDMFIGKEYYSNYSTYRVNMFVEFVKLKKWQYAIEEICILLRLRKLNFKQSIYYVVREIEIVRKLYSMYRNLHNVPSKIKS